MTDAGEDPENRSNATNQPDRNGQPDSPAGGIAGDAQPPAGAPDGNANHAEMPDRFLNACAAICTVATTLGSIVTQKAGLLLVASLISMLVGAWVLITSRERRLSLGTSTVIITLIVIGGFLGGLGVPLVLRPVGAKVTAVFSSPEPTTKNTLPPKKCRDRAPTKGGGTIAFPSESAKVGAVTPFNGTTSVSDPKVLWILSESCNDPYFWWPARVVQIEKNWSSNVILGQEGNGYSDLKFRVRLVVADGSAAQALSDHYDRSGGKQPINEDLFQKGPFRKGIRGLDEVQVTRR